MTHEQTKPGMSCADLAKRWKMSQRTAFEFLEAFERLGLVERDGLHWRATDRAVREYRILGFVTDAA